MRMHTTNCYEYYDSYSRVLVYELVLWILANAHNIIIITWCTNSEYYVSII